MKINLVLALFCVLNSAEAIDYWLYSSPSEESMNRDLLANLGEKFTEGQYGYIDHMLIIKNGTIVYEKSYEHDYAKINEGRDTTYRYYNANLYPYHKNTGLHSMQSVTKSITSVVIGIAIANGDFPDVDVKMMEFFAEDDVQHLDNKKQNITIEDLLTMTPGFEWNEFSVPYHHPKNDCRLMEESSDWITFVVNRPMAYAPGTHFAYSSGVSQLLSAIFYKSAGMTISDYAKKHLFAPLGIQDFYWQETPKGLPDTEGGLFLYPGDLAKIGQLYLQEGKWGELQILPKNWVRDSGQMHVSDTGLYGDGKQNRGFGYHWWILPYAIGEKTSRIYAALGYGGQRLFIVPGHDLVAVFTGWNIYEFDALHIRVFQDFVLKAVENQ